MFPAIDRTSAIISGGQSNLQRTFRAQNYLSKNLIFGGRPEQDFQPFQPLSNICDISGLKSYRSDAGGKGRKEGKRDR